MARHLWDSEDVVPDKRTYAKLTAGLLLAASTASIIFIILYLCGAFS